jgi:hypothetical protein
MDPDKNYEIGPRQAALGNPSEAERWSVKADFVGYKVSRMRVQQIWRTLREQKQEPQIGKNQGQPRELLDN